MPSKIILEQKQAAVEQLADKLKGSVAGVLVDYKGITVEDDTKLRKELREAGVEYFVIKNGILRRACEKVGFDGLKNVLVGTTAIAISSNDAVAPAKIIAKFAGESKDKFNIKAGFVEGKIVEVAEINALAKLPSREELVAQTLRGFNAPISGFVNVLNANIRGLVIALNQIAQKSA